MLAPYRAFEASDRYIVIAAGNDNLFRRLCGVIDRPQWPADPRFETNAARVANREVLNTMIEEIIATRNADAWSEALTAVGVPCAPLQSTGEVVRHAQTEALGLLQPTPDGQMQLVALPLRFDGQRPTVRNAAPELGADNGQISDMAAPPPDHVPTLPAQTGPEDEL